MHAPPEFFLFMVFFCFGDSERGGGAGCAPPPLDPPLKCQELYYKAETVYVTVRIRMCASWFTNPHPAITTIVVFNLFY